MNFADAVRHDQRKTYTENGATAVSTTNSGLLDFFGSAGSLRQADELRVKRLFSAAIHDDPLLAMKALFYIRDIRGGLGERETFRILLKETAINHPEFVRNNISLIGEYGRFDDLYALCNTPLEDKMWAFVKTQLLQDEQNMRENKPCSLLAKWLKTADAKSTNTRLLGIHTANKLGMSVYEYKRRIRALRKYIDILEAKMSAKEWQDIKYETVPSRAMLNHRKAFKRNDADRYNAFISSADKGEAKINAATLFPYDLIEKYVPHCMPNSFRNVQYDQSIEAQWKALPDYVGRKANAMVIADTSGSMSGRPLCSAVGLAIYFAQRNQGAYHNMWMSFSSDSTIHTLYGDTLAENMRYLDVSDWDSNTNLERALMRILEIAKNNNVPQNEMVKSLIIISDMEIDHCVSSRWMFYDEMAMRYAQAGYEIPNIMFWNVNSRHDIFHADKNRRGVQLCSGQSASTFKILMQSIGMTPTEMMLSVLNSERYAAISINA